MVVVLRGNLEDWRYSSFSIRVYSGVFKDTFSIQSSPRVSVHLYWFINKIYSCLAEMYHLLPRFLLQVNVSCQGSCPGLRWLSMTYLYAPVWASLGSELCIWRDSTPSRHVSILSPLTRPILCTWKELCKHFIWIVDRSRCFWKGQGMKGQFTLFSNSSAAHSGHNWHLPSNCPQDSLFLQGRTFEMELTWILLCRGEVWAGT